MIILSNQRKIYNYRDFLHEHDFEYAVENMKSLYEEHYDYKPNENTKNQIEESFIDKSDTSKMSLPLILTAKDSIFNLLPEHFSQRFLVWNFEPKKLFTTNFFLPRQI